jgi:hypothetical protein
MKILDRGTYLEIHLDRKTAALLAGAFRLVAQQWEPLGDLQSKELVTLLHTLSKGIKEILEGRKMK